MNIAEDGSPFVGRHTELGKIVELFSTPSCRLLTLVGPGGIGKTRLVLEAARQFKFPDGVHFVPLQPLSSPDFVLVTIANEIGCSFMPGGDPHQQLIDHFRDKSLLLVLDNLEHLLDAADLFSAILKSAPDVRIIATSRERLNLVEEWVLDLSGLDFPPDESENDIELYGAVQLFMQHARRVKVDFALRDAQKPALIRICRLVGGMPLALELAASWVRILTCEAIAAEIEKGLEILETSTRNIEPRHRTMRAALDWSWNLLSPIEQNVLQKLSVFHGGFTLDAAAYVAGASLRNMTTLVDKSLVRTAADGRYDLHELLRQYAAEKLHASPNENHQTHDLHCAFYAELMNQQWGHLQSNQQRAAMHTIQTEIDNVQIAWQWAVELKRATEIEKILESFWFFYDARLWFDTAEKALKSAIDAFSPIKAEHSLLYSKLLVRYGLFGQPLGQQESCRVLVEEALIILDRLAARQETALALQTLAWLHWGEKTIRLLRESLVIYREVGDYWGTARVLNWLAVETLFDNDCTVAVQMSQESLAFYEEIGNPSGIADNLCILGWCAYRQEDYSEAIKFHQEELTFALEAQNDWHIMESQLGLGLNHWLLGERSKALPLFDAGLKQALTIGPQLVPSIPYVLVEVWTAFDEVRAVELLALAFRPAQWTLPHPTKKHGQQALEKLKAELPPDKFQAAFERGKDLDLRATVQWLILQLQGFQNDSPSPPQTTILNPREVEVLRLIAEGLSNREIAERLVLSISTIKWYNNEIFSKLDVRSRTQAILQAQSLGLLA